MGPAGFGEEKKCADSRARATSRPRGSMSPSRQGHAISRQLVRIVRESSRLSDEDSDAPLSKHLQAVDDRKAQALEFYLRACAMRLAAPS